MSWLRRMTPSRGPSLLDCPSFSSRLMCSLLSSSESPGAPRTTGKPLWLQCRSTHVTYATLSIVLNVLDNGSGTSQPPLLVSSLSLSGHWHNSLYRVSLLECPDRNSSSMLELFTSASCMERAALWTRRQDACKAPATGSPDCLAGDVYGLFGVQALRWGGPQEDDRAISFQICLVDAIAVNGLTDPVAADDCNDDAHNEAGVLHTHTAPLISLGDPSLINAACMPGCDSMTRCKGVSQ